MSPNFVSNTNQFQANVDFSIASKNVRKTDVSREYRNGTLAWSGLREFEMEFEFRIQSNKDWKTITRPEFTRKRRIQRWKEYGKAD